MARQAQNNTVAQAQNSTVAQARLNFAKVSESFLSDFNATGKVVLDYAIARKSLKDAKDAYTGNRKDSDGKMAQEFRTYLKPFTQAQAQAKKDAERITGRFLAYYGQDAHSFRLDGSDAIIDVNALLHNMGVLDGNIEDLSKEKQVQAVQGLMDGITGRIKSSITTQAKYNNVLKFGTVKVVDDNVIDTFLMLEVALSAYTVLKACYTGKDGQYIPYVRTAQNGTFYVDGVGYERQARTLVNTVKTPIQAQDATQA